ncbi:9336_t:CDS:2, partial [Funneliformis mosseae]
TINIYSLKQQYNVERVEGNSKKVINRRVEFERSRELELKKKGEYDYEITRPSKSSS